MKTLSEHAANLRSIAGPLVPDSPIGELNQRQTREAADALDAALAMLREVTRGGYCEICGGSGGHLPDCKLAELIGAE